MLSLEKQRQVKNEILQIIKNVSLDDSSILAIKELSTTYKNFSFKEEREVRITYTPKNLHQDEIHSCSNDILGRLSDKRFRYQNNQIIPYHEFDFSNKCNSLLIPEIILGPKCVLNKNDLIDFLEVNDFENIQVKRSKSSYR